MDLIGDMLVDTIPSVACGQVSVSQLRPGMVPRLTRLPIVGRGRRAHLADRLVSRLYDYPKWLAPRAGDFDVFHVVDHSYAHLVRVLPADRTVVTCHDVDGIQPALPGEHAWPRVATLLARRIFDGLTRAGHIACVSAATRDQLLATGAIDPLRVSVVHEGVHPSCTPGSGGSASGRGVELLHVGSTIPRKRIDVLLEVFAAARQGQKDLRLVRVGGALTGAQRDRAARLGVMDAITEVPFVERPQLAELYQRAALVLMPSEREGFGLPVVEAMACGTPVVASDLPALREVGGDAASYCRVGAVEQWAATIATLLRERALSPDRWEVRRRAALQQAAKFSWTEYARRSIVIYENLLRASGSRA